MPRRERTRQLQAQPRRSTISGQKDNAVPIVATFRRIETLWPLSSIYSCLSDTPCIAQKQDERDLRNVLPKDGRTRPFTVSIDASKTQKRQHLWKILSFFVSFSCYSAKKRYLPIPSPTATRTSDAGARLSGLLYMPNTMPTMPRPAMRKRRKENEDGGT